MRCSIMKKDPWDFITEIGFRKSGPELRAFNQQLDSIVVGNFFPGEAPTVLDPNKFPDATEAHEHIHQELTMATTFGGLFTILATLTKVGHFEAESVFCLNQQWAAQEGCATYAGMATIAQSDPDKLPDAIERLPSLNAKDWPYRELFQLVSRQLPLLPKPVRPRLESQMSTSLA